MSAACGPLCGWCGACTAAWERDDDDREPESSQRICAVVTLVTGEQRAFLDAVADVFDSNWALTISDVDTEDEIAVFVPQLWKNVLVLDRDGHPLFGYERPDGIALTPSQPAA